MKEIPETAAGFNTSENAVRFAKPAVLSNGPRNVVFLSAQRARRLPPQNTPADTRSDVGGRRQAVCEWDYIGFWALIGSVYLAIGVGIYRLIVVAL